MKERRKHVRLPVIKDLAEPIELTVMDASSPKTIPGILTNFSSGGMDLVLMGIPPEKPHVKLSLHLPGLGRFSVEGKIIWNHIKGETSRLGIEFTKIDEDHKNQIRHISLAYWECEGRIKKEAQVICFQGCAYWDLCEKPVKLDQKNKTPHS